MRVWDPEEIAGQPRRWASVGAANASPNQVRVTWLNGASGSRAGTVGAVYRRGGRLVAGANIE